MIENKLASLEATLGLCLFPFYSTSSLSFILSISIKSFLTTNTPTVCTICLFSHFDIEDIFSKLYTYHF